MNYDYIIVGAGSAGCVLAARLTEDPNCQVALLEAGGEDSASAVNQPSLWPTLWDGSENWGYSTALQPGYGLRSIPYPRGKVLGGTSAINAMIYVRGDARDFDNWASLGNAGWGWREVLPYFIKSEDQQHGASQHHGVGGPLRVQDPQAPSRMSIAFVESATRAGHQKVQDFNAGNLRGAGLYQLNIRDGQRCSTARAYLHPARQRPNLHVLTRARAVRIALEGTRASGVDYFDGARLVRVNARCEVILSAGAVDSPRLLMLSGIGDPAQLKAAGVAVEIGLPGVGAQLCDHPMTNLVHAQGARDEVSNACNLVEGGLFMPSANTRSDWSADIQFFAVPFAPLQMAALGKARMSVISVQVCRPRSRGRVALRSADPFDHPIIDPRFLTDAQDLILQREGLREARAIASQEPLKSLLGPELFPGPGLQDDAALEQYIRSTSATIWHPVGTCRMGNDADAVVDSALRVHGVDGLRVVDASIMPQITSGNPNAATIMIAEKAAEMMRR